MHNIDRTNLESNYGEYVGEYPGEYAGEFAGEYPGEYAGEYTGEYAGEYTGEYTGEYPGEYTGEYTGEYGNQEFGYEEEGNYESGEYAQESPFSEAEEMELAAELLTISNEAELEYFLGGLLKKAAGFIKTPLGQQLIGKLKGIAKNALPMLGGSLGNLIAPGVGGALGRQLATRASSMFGLELEGLSQEDQEFEVARQLVRLGGTAASIAAEAPPTVPPPQAANTALTAAAQQYAPGYVRSQGPQIRDHRCRHRNTGRWVRRQNGILLLGA